MISTPIDGRTYSARITQARFSAYIEVWGDGWDYAENIATCDAMAAIMDSARGGHDFPPAQEDVLRMAAVIYARSAECARAPEESSRLPASIPRQRTRTDQQVPQVIWSAG